MAKKNTKKTDATSNSPTTFTVNFTNAIIGSGYSITLDGPGISFGGGIVTKENFSIDIPQEYAGNVRVRIGMSQKKRNIATTSYAIDFTLDRNLTVSLAMPQAEKPKSSGKKFLGNKLQEAIIEKKEEKSEDQTSDDRIQENVEKKEETKEEEKESKSGVDMLSSLLGNRLRDQIQENKSDNSEA